MDQPDEEIADKSMKQPVTGIYKNTIANELIVYKNAVAYEEDGGDDVQSIAGPSSTKRRKTDNTKISHKENATESNKISFVSHAEELKHFMEVKWKCRETDEDYKMSNNIISILFAHDLDHILQTIFLFLDPLSMKASRQVCQQWEEFIKRRIWGSKPGSLPYKSLRRRLDHHWRHAIPDVKTISVGGSINCMSCDDSMVLCGMMNATAKVFDIISLDMLIVLDCRNKNDKDNVLRVNANVETDIGKEVICTVNARDYVCVWRKSDWSLLYEQCRKFGLSAVRIINNYIIMGDICGWISVLRLDGNQVTLISTVENDPSSQTLYLNPKIHCIESDGIWILAGSRRRLNLWRLEDCQKVKSFETCRIASSPVSLFYPFVITPEAVGGVTIFDLEKSEKIRSDLWMKPFCNVHNNGKFIGAMTRRKNYLSGGKYYVNLYSIEELTNVKMAQEKFWTRSKHIMGRGEDGVGMVALNTSCLVTALGKKVHVWDFWNCDKLVDGPALKLHGLGTY